MVSILGLARYICLAITAPSNMLWFWQFFEFSGKSKDIICTIFWYYVLHDNVVSSSIYLKTLILFRAHMYIFNSKPKKIPTYWVFIWSNDRIRTLIHKPVLKTMVMKFLNLDQLCHFFGQKIDHSKFLEFFKVPKMRAVW